MNIHNEVVDAVLKAYSWKLVKKDICSVIDKNDTIVIFVSNNDSYKYFFSIEDLYYTLKYTNVMCDSFGQHENPYVKLSDHEILVKCDLFY